MSDVDDELRNDLLKTLRAGLEPLNKVLKGNDQIFDQLLDTLATAETIVVKDYVHQQQQSSYKQGFSDGQDSLLDNGQIRLYTDQELQDVKQKAVREVLTRLHKKSRGVYSRQGNALTLVISDKDWQAELERLDKGQNE